MPSNISIIGNIISSDANLPTYVADASAHWKPKIKQMAKALLQTVDVIECRDATAYAAMLSLCIDMAMKFKIRAKLIKLY